MPSDGHASVTEVVSVAAGLSRLRKKYRTPIIAFALGILAIVVCYFFVDRPVTWFFYVHQVYPDGFLYWPPVISGWVEYAVMAGMVAVVVWRICRPGGELQNLLLAISVNLAVTAGIKTFLKGAFGRSWPRDWIRAQAAGLANEVYGFHPFGFKQGFHSFPSGHAAVTFAALSILWIARPKWRWPCAAVGVLMCLSLVAWEYHFVSDVIAGALLGSFTGMCTARIFGIEPPRV